MSFVISLFLFFIEKPKNQKRQTIKIIEIQKRKSKHNGIHDNLVILEIKYT